MVNLTKFDMAEYLDNEELILEYLNQALSEDNPKAFLKALNTVSRAQGMNNIAQKTGLSREALYHSLSEKGNPRWETMWKIASALGLTLSVCKASAHA